MIFFLDNGGTVIKSFPAPVYQGSVNANNIYVIAPFAENLTVTVAFRLPNGVITERYFMTPVNEISGVTDSKTGKTYSGWQFSMPNTLTKYFGNVKVQFYFYSAQGETVASSSTDFQVGKGVPGILPDEPSADVYAAILSQISGLQQQLNSGTYASRAIYAWNSTYTYGANEITFYPDIGEFGAFVKSIKDNNTNNAPYIDDTLNKGWWSEVVNFNTITEDYLTTVKEAIANGVDLVSDTGDKYIANMESIANRAEDSAEEAKQAQSKAESAQASADQAMSEAIRQATNSAESAQQAEEAYAEASKQATAASESASQAAASEQRAAEIVTAADDAKLAAAESAATAESWAEIAKQWADYGIKINTEYKSLAELPIPGDSHYIYLIPNGSTGENSYDEYIWADSKGAYEKIGTTEIDLTDYVSKSGGTMTGILRVDTIESGTVPGMSLIRSGHPTYSSETGVKVKVGNVSCPLMLYGETERPYYRTFLDDPLPDIYKEPMESEELALKSDVEKVELGSVKKSGDTIEGSLQINGALRGKDGTGKIYILPQLDLSQLTGGTGTVDNIKALLIWICKNYPNVDSGRWIGRATPNSQGMIDISIYNTSIINSEGLPRYSEGRYQSIGARVYLFGTNDYNWFWQYAVVNTDIENATSSTYGLVKLGSDTVLDYPSSNPGIKPVQVNASGKMVVDTGIVQTSLTVVTIVNNLSIPLYIVGAIRDAAGTRSLNIEIASGSRASYSMLGGPIILTTGTSSGAPTIARITAGSSIILAGSHGVSSTSTTNYSFRAMAPAYYSATIYWSFNKLYPLLIYSTSTSSTYNTITISAP